MRDSMSKKKYDFLDDLIIMCLLENKLSAGLLWFTSIIRILYPDRQDRKNKKSLSQVCRDR